MKKKMFTLMMVALATTGARAQWNTGTKPAVIMDCSQAGTDYYGTNLNVGRTTDGKTWLEYVIWEDEGVHHYVQLLDENGVKQFEDPGIRLNNYPTHSWWSWNNMVVASDGSVVVSLADARSETPDAEGNYYSFQPSVYKISQDGDFLWGLDGITFKEYQDAPYTNLFQNGDDIFFQCYELDENHMGMTSMMNRISPDGTLAFSECKPVFGQMVPTTGGDMLVFYSGGYGSTVNRLNRDLEPVWDEPVTFDSNPYGGHDNRPYKIAVDGQGGAAVTFERLMGQSAHNIRLQHINGDGTLGFGLDGIDTYNGTDGDHSYSGVAVNTETQEILCDWEDQLFDADKGTNYYTTTVGKYSFDGTRHWGDYGIHLGEKFSSSGFAYARIGAGPVGDGQWIVAYRDVAAYGQEFITVKRIDKDGNELWKKNYGRSLEVTDEHIFVEDDFTYIFFRGKQSIDVLRVSNQDGTANGIENANIDTPENARPVAWYTADGKQLSQPAKGLNIVKMSDGTSRKMFKK